MTMTSHSCLQVHVPECHEYVSLYGFILNQIHLPDCRIFTWISPCQLWPKQQICQVHGEAGMGEAGLGSAQEGLYFLINVYELSLYIMYTKYVKVHQTYSPSLIMSNSCPTVGVNPQPCQSLPTFTQRAGHSGH